MCLFWDEENKIYIIRRAGASSPLVSSEGWRNSGGRKKRREREIVLATSSTREDGLFVSSFFTSFSENLVLWEESEYHSD